MTTNDMTSTETTADASHAATGVRPSSGAPAVHLRDVRVSFPAPHGRRVTALDGVTLDVAEREIVAILGPNGSGKSTLLRIVDGLLPPDTGTVEIEGRTVTGPQRAVGFVFQEPRLLPWRSSLENVAYPLELAGVGPAERLRRADDLLALVGVRAWTDARPHELSGGIRQRVSVARALALEPSILLLDEPFSALDALTRERFNLELLHLWERTATTILLVTHSIPEALFVADRVVVLSGAPGRVVSIVSSPLGRPRSLEDLASPTLARAASDLRSMLVGFTDDAAEARDGDA